jgi:hypothetical protein
MKLADKVSNVEGMAATQKLDQLVSFETSVRSINALDLDDSLAIEQSIIVDAIKLLAAMTEYLQTSLLYLKSCFLKNMVKTVFSKTNVVVAAKNLDEAAKAFRSKQASDYSTLEAKIRHRKRDEQEMLRNLSELNYASIHNDKSKVRSDEKTTNWIFEEPKYKDWRTTSKHLLWCNGVRGVGKTCLALVIIVYTLLHS